MVTKSVRAARPHGGGPRLPRESDALRTRGRIVLTVDWTRAQGGWKRLLKGGSADEEARDSPGQWAPPDPAFVHWPPAPCAGSAPRFADGRPSSTPLRHAAGSASSQLDFCTKTPGAPSHTSPLSVAPPSWPPGGPFRVVRCLSGTSHPLLTPTSLLHQTQLLPLWHHPGAAATSARKSERPALLLEPLPHGPPCAHPRSSCRPATVTDGPPSVWPAHSLPARP